MEDNAHSPSACSCSPLHEVGTYSLETSVSEAKQA